VVDGGAGAIREWCGPRPVLKEAVAGPKDCRSGPSVVSSSWRLRSGALGQCLAASDLQSGHGPRAMTVHEDDSRA
jgi:hypothetical protein